MHQLSQLVHKPSFFFDAYLVAFAGDKQRLLFSYNLDQTIVEKNTKFFTVKPL
jgi:hypothetical protein